MFKYLTLMLSALQPKASGRKALKKEMTHFFEHSPLKVKKWCFIVIGNVVKNLFIDEKDSSSCLLRMTFCFLSF
ncbi:hypothetical protein DDZ16_19235 [Marinilabilia rubra]|uniref:Uncharacterized protein n=1 Tax=Marinilabilia rubra TaxID=2162893 RepID=A0A2U2B3Y3_9BACT|nr:hypothetical protein DDZ16_19235 [Marinilabilia rubra]